MRQISSAKEPLKKIKNRIGAQETYESHWLKYLAKVRKSSNVNDLEIIPLNKIQKMQTMIYFQMFFPELSQSSQHYGCRK